MMKISIVVPAFNEEKLLGATLRTIRTATDKFHLRGWKTELIVCDNNSTDRTAEIARAEGADVVFEPVNQIARARNAGAARANGDWLIFVDADSHPAPGLFEDVAAAIEAGRCIAGGATVRPDTSGLSMRIAVGLWNVLSRLSRWCAGSFIFCEASAFREIGGFNSELFVSEEVDLSKKLKACARRRGKNVVILRRHPLVTSARKLDLYGHWAHIAFVLKVLFTGGNAMRTREECAIWYDGKR